jgi:hypothetical protein
MDASEVRSLMEAYASIYKEETEECSEEFDFVVDFLISEGIAEDSDDAAFMIDNELDEETINEILGLLKKKKDKSNYDPAGRSMINPHKKPPYVVDKAPPKMKVYKFGK